MKLEYCRIIEEEDKKIKPICNNSDFLLFNTVSNSELDEDNLKRISKLKNNLK
jgi:hypothetical protein